MSPEGFKNKNSEESSELDEAMKHLKESMDTRSDEIESFESNNGFQVSIRTFSDGTKNADLSKEGFISKHSISSEGKLSFMEFRGPDNEHDYDNVRRRSHHNEAELLFLDKTDTGSHQTKDGLTKKEYFDTINAEKQRHGDPSD